MTTILKFLALALIYLPLGIAHAATSAISTESGIISAIANPVGGALMDEIYSIRHAFFG